MRRDTLTLTLTLALTLALALTLTLTLTLITYLISLLFKPHSPLSNRFIFITSLAQHLL